MWVQNHAVHDFESNLIEALLPFLAPSLCANVLVTL